MTSMVIFAAICAMGVFAVVTGIVLWQEHRSRIRLFAGLMAQSRANMSPEAKVYDDILQRANATVLERRKKGLQAP